MKLQVNLIPAIAYALVTMFAHTAGWTREEEKKQPQKNQFSTSWPANKLKNWNKNVFITGHGQIYLSNDFQNSSLVWVVPGTNGSQLLFAVTEEYSESGTAGLTWYHS